MQHVAAKDAAQCKQVPNDDQQYLKISSLMTIEKGVNAWVQKRQ
jgi:hypothetical protein